jgi:hypothetical protein
MMFPTISAIAARRPNRPPDLTSPSVAAAGSALEDIDPPFEEQ